MNNKFSIKVQLIAAILIAAFLIQDIAWACPFERYKNLAVTGLKNPETLQNLKIAMSRKLKTGSPDMAKSKDGGHFDAYPDSDIVNSFIRNHIVEGRAVEVDEKEEKVVIIRRDYTNPRAPDIEDLFKTNGIFSKIRQAKDPALFKKILIEKNNFRNLSPKEQKKIIQITQSIRLSLILGHVIVCERQYEQDNIVAHARTGFNRHYHHLEPAVWIGEILFNRLTVEQSAQLLLEEALHILKPAKKHGKIDEAENPKEVIEHDEEFIDALDTSPASSDELAVSAWGITSGSQAVAKEKQIKDYQSAESIYKDYFEAIFEFNLKLFVLMAKRMKAKRIYDETMLEKLKADTEECLNKMEGEIRNFEGRLKDLPKDLSMIDSHNRVKEQFVKAEELISKNNEPAANAALICALIVFLVVRKEILNAKISKSSRRVRVIKEDNKIVMWQQRYIRPDEDAKTLIPVYTKIPFDLRWQAGRSLDEQEEGVMDEREEVMDYLKRIATAQKIAEKNPSSLAVEDINYIISSLGRVKVEERRLALIVLKTVKELIKIESPAEIKYLLPIAKIYLELRIKDIDDILYHLKIGRAEPFRDIVAGDNVRFISKIAEIKEVMKEGKYSQALEKVWGFKKNIEPYLAEPDLEELSLMIWVAIHTLKELKSKDKIAAPNYVQTKAEFWINLIEKRLKNSQRLNAFMSLFREEYILRRLAGNSASLKENTFNDVFEYFVKSKQLIRGSPQTEALRILCYLAAFVQLEIKDPSRPSRKIPNPLFKALNTLCIMTNLNDIAQILGINRLKKLSKTITVLNRFSPKRSINSLSSSERAKLIEAMIEDYSLTVENSRDTLSSANPESPNMAKGDTPVNRQRAPDLSVNIICSKILALDGREIIDNENEHFILDVKKKEHAVYPIVITIKRKTHHMAIGTIGLDIKGTLMGGKYILDLGLIHINRKEYRSRGIFTRAFSLISEVMPPNSGLRILSLEETKTLKALADGTEWSETRMGRILYSCGWEPETISIYKYPTSSTVVLFDRNNKWQGFYNPRNFRIELEIAIEDIDKTDQIKDAVVCVNLTKTAKETEFKEYSNREKLSKPESPDMAKERMLLNRQDTPSLPVNVVYNKILALNDSEVIDNENEHFILDVRNTKSLFYPIFVNIRRKQDHISIGTVELDVRYITVGGGYILDLGLAHISLKKYRNRGIFPRVLSLISEVMPPNSKLDLSSVQEAEALKALATGKDWSETRIGRILYGCGWAPEFIAIFDHSQYSEALLLDKNNELPKFYNPDNFKVILSKAIKDIDKTDEISDGVTVYVRLDKITDRARINESLSRERLSNPESPNMAKRNTEKIEGEGIEDMLLAVHSVVQSRINTNPFPEGSRVLLSNNLFEEMDRVNLERLLKGGNIEILDPKDIKRRATNNKVARDKMVIVLTKEEFEAIWKNPDERLWIRSSVLLLDDRLTGPNYLYLEGVIGLARAIMGRDKRSIAAFYNMLSGMKLDEAALACLEDNAVAFAIKAILKFKPIEADSRRLGNYKVMMETFLVSA